ncbi:tryptophan synthase subunit alpha [Bacteroides caecigallinarum]|uniref:tryptophan synthase subunit alpha n=1 Tax=Bacteroides caecigallinarum TaxID=1411144 RepID=UPI001F3C197D|nr:tryptophan synthase subunit alpha [Bacteroides caecigallinarum]MCF2736284.1 tryptophan synthase subunit alpha [Bacteroides caecigallinarum]
MDRINELFSNKKHDILSIYFCAGAPKANNTAEVITSLEKNGVDMIEIGVPFSDPLADGPVIQNASCQALRNGMTLTGLFAQLEGIRNTVSIPLILMGYLNPIMQYGMEQFFRSCSSTGIDGAIIPDLPFDEYMQSVKPIAEKYGIKVIMLITPETSEERIRLIDDNTEGFIYMVSSAAVTGAQKDFDARKQEYFKRIEGMNLRNPRMIGFGISNPQTYEAAAKHASGCIIGSRFVTLLNEENGNADRAIERLKRNLEI